MTFKNEHGLLCFTSNGKDITSDKGGTFDVAETCPLIDTYLAKGWIKMVSKELVKPNTK